MKRSLAVVAALVFVVAAAATFRNGTPGTLAMNAGDSTHVTCAGPSLAYGNATGTAGDLTCAPKPTTTTVPATTTTIPATTTTAPVTTTTVPATTTTTVAGACGLNRDPACNWPGAGNTGPPAGTTFSAPVTTDARYTWDGSTLSITTANVHLDSMDIPGAVYVSAPGVLITNSRIDDPDKLNAGLVVLVDYNNPAAHLTITDSEVWDTQAAARAGCEAVIGFGSYTAQRVNLHSCSGDIAKANGATTISDSWLHGSVDLNNGAHIDTIQTTQGANITIQHNTLDASSGASDTFQGLCDQGSVSGFAFKNNLLIGGAWMVSAGGGGCNPGFTISGIVYTGNHFSHVPAPTYGPVVYAVNPAITWTGNIWDDTGTTIPAN